MESITPRAVGAIVLSAIILNAIFLIVIFYTRRKLAQAESWSSTVGTVTFSAIDVRKSGNRNSIQYPVVRYSYQVMGREYEANKIMPGPEVGGSGAQKVVERYPVGAQVTVFYDPNYPSNALLERGMPGYIKWLWVILVFLDMFLITAAIIRAYVLQ